MSFIWPAFLISLLFAPLFVLFYVYLQRRRKIPASFSVLGGPKNAAGKKLGVRRHLAPALFLAGITLLLLAMARPQAVVTLPRNTGTVILAFDVSGSMAADDLAPTRMEAAKAAAREFVENQPSTLQIGVVSFSDSGFSVQPPTNDQPAILSAINRLSPQRSTSIANGILMSLMTIEAGQREIKDGPRLYSNITPEPTATPTPMPAGIYQPAVIVLLTDGENTASPDPYEAAQTAADRGVRIFTVGIGSAAGATLEIDGFSIHTQLDEAALEQISQMTNGAYYNAQNEQDLQDIYNNIRPQLVIKPEKMEITSILAGASILLLLIGSAFSFFWFGRFP